MSELAKNLVSYYAHGCVSALERGKPDLARDYARMAWSLIA